MAFEYIQESVYSYEQQSMNFIGFPDHLKKTDFMNKQIQAHLQNA